MASQFTPEQTSFMRREFKIVGQVLFPNILKLKKKDKAEDRDIYDVQFVFDPQKNAQTVNEMLNHLQQCTQIAHQGINPAAILAPIKASKVQGWPEYVKQNGQMNADYLAGKLWVNASTGRDLPPSVFKLLPGGMAQKLTADDNAEVYSGRNAVIIVTFWPMLPKPGSVNQKRGFYVNLQQVLLLDGGDKIGGQQEVDPYKSFQGFVQDMGGTPNFGGFGSAPQGNAPAPQGTNQHGQQNHGNQTQGYPQGGNGQTAPSYASPSNGQLPPMGNPPQGQFAPNNNQQWPPTAPNGQQQQQQFQHHAPNSYNPYGSN